MSYRCERNECLKALRSYFVKTVTSGEAFLFLPNWISVPSFDWCYSKIPSQPCFISHLTDLEIVFYRCLHDIIVCFCILSLASGYYGDGESDRGSCPRNLVAIAYS